MSGYMNKSPYAVTYICEKCGEPYTCNEWDVIQVLNQYGFGFSGTDTVKLCLDCFEGMCLWWEAYFDDPENQAEFKFIMDMGLHI